ELSELDFSDPKSAQLINNWVREKTSGKIDRIVADRLDPMMVMYVLNAIYFKGSWSDEFDKKRTHPDKFLLSDNSSIMTDMMNKETDLEYFENELFQAVNLPYGNGAFMMTVLLPQSNKNLTDLIENLTIEKWNTWKDGFSMLDGVLSLPKFKLAYEIELKKILKSLGMNAPFQSNLADFSQITTSSELFIDEIKQKTYVDVNEEGTEATAVTSVGMKTVSIPKPGFIMKVNRPFLFMIRDQKSILFIGKISSPE
ncbi:MAG: serpin family protein, partial [Candidatus Cloacimonetes bacterium]|nr:serpin family protein [Candidatus Cloacimonadota bacterium]